MSKLQIEEYGNTILLNPFEYSLHVTVLTTFTYVTMSFSFQFQDILLSIDIFHSACHSL